MTISGINANHQQALFEGAGIGGLIGTFLGRPILGAIGGLVYKLFSTDGLAEAATKLVGDVTGNQDPVGAFGKFFGVNDSSSAPKASSADSTSTASAAPSTPGIPGWAKALGIGALALGAVSFLQDNVANTFLGIPYGGGGLFGGGLFGGGAPYFGQAYYGGYGFGYW